MLWLSAISCSSYDGYSAFVPIVQPFFWLYPSAHQPSKTLKFTTPFTDAFCPLVPDASIGLLGLFSQTSTPLTKYLEISIL